ncbi:MAG TPA: P-II family nitrogen regulator [Rhodospirillales bacterium]|nr:MAG: Nitrogen regulatory protein P-II [Alphaproteobacteria bacterium MarineAlpha3_Bin3]HIM42906.1 P-II family nitrogen regulator [Rhodospirillales bacterium]HIN21604.1 P-II family nitrogen regulator [Rhodospirillales bacterium]
MKLIMAIIKPFKLDAVREALTELGVQGLTVSEVKGFGRQKGQTEIYRGAEYAIEFVPKVRLDIVIDDAEADRVVEAIRDAANTDKIGDGKIFVLDVVQSMRIRTGETGSDAL